MEINDSLQIRFHMFYIETGLENIRKGNFMVVNGFIEDYNIAVGAIS